MKQNSYFQGQGQFRLILVGLLMITIISSISVILFSKSTENYLRKKAKDDIAKQISFAKENLNREGQDFFCRRLNKNDYFRITLISNAGQVVCDSHSGKYDNHLMRPEIQAATESKVSYSSRYSKSLDKKMVYGASKISLGSKKFFLRAAIPTLTITNILKELFNQTLFRLVPILFVLLIIFLYFILNYSKSFISLLEKSNIAIKKKSDQIRADFVANVSHELKTPITSIKGFSQLLSQTNIKDEKAQKYIGKILSNSEKLVDLFEDLLQLSRIESNELLELSDFSISHTSEDIVLELKEKYANKNIEIHKNIQFDKIHVNPKLFRQVLFNLIENAIKYSHQDVLIEILSHKVENTLYLSVKDNGIGIPRNKQERIFERFFRVTESRSDEVKGTGLGLSIVKHIVNKHNGKISVSSNTSGSKFTISLPL